MHAFFHNLITVLLILFYTNYLKILFIAIVIGGVLAITHCSITSLPHNKTENLCSLPMQLRMPTLTYKLIELKKNWAFEAIQTQFTLCQCTMPHGEKELISMEVVNLFCEIWMRDGDHKHIQCSRKLDFLL